MSLENVAGENWRVRVEELTDAGDGQIIRVADYTERQDALEAAGLRE